MLAGLLRIGVVAVAAGGLGAGVYFMAEGGQEGGGDRLQARPTQTRTVPTPSVTPGPLDTSDWKTYTSALGFTIKYPPTWAVVQFDPDNNYVRILNERAQTEHARRVAEGIDEEAPKSGEAWIELGPGPPKFDVEGLFGICGGTATTVTFQDLPAVRCGSSVYWIGLPSGSVVQISSPAVEAGPDTLGMLASMLSTVSFNSSP